MSFSSEASASIAGKIAVEIAAEALEDFLKDEDNQDLIVKGVAGSVTKTSKAISQTKQYEKNLDNFLEEGDEQ